MLDVVRCYFEPTARSRTTSRTRCCPRTASSSSRRREEGADFGVAYDGDADRCFFVDDTGEFVPGDFTRRSSRRRSSRRSPGGKVIYDVRASWAVPETIERAGGVPLMNRVGHAFIKQRMREEDAVFAGEVSAHYYFRDFSQADSGTVPFLLMCELVSKPTAS
jgi:phosphomannomutase